MFTSFWSVPTFEVKADEVELPEAGVSKIEEQKSRPQSLKFSDREVHVEETTSHLSNRQQSIIERWNEDIKMNFDPTLVGSGVETLKDEVVHQAEYYRNYATTVLLNTLNPSM